MQVSGIGSSYGTDVTSMQKMMEQMKKRFFEKMDSDGDGYVNSSDLTDLAKTTDMSATDIITKYDSDGDGQLDATEFDAMMKEVRPKFRPDGMQGPPPPPSDDTGTSNSVDTESSKHIQSLISLLESGKTEEAQTLMQNMLASLNANAYGMTGTDSSPAFLLKAQA